MSIFDQIPFGEEDFAGNPEPRCACLLLLDTSQSMSGAPIAELNCGIRQLKTELAEDSLAMKRVEIAMITFGPVETVADFRTPDYFDPPTLLASGNTPMGEAIETGLNLLRSRKDKYKDNGIPYYRPWVFLITDGAPTDSWQRAAALIHEGEEKEAFSFFPIAVQGADLSVLKQLTAINQPIKLSGLRFRELFAWLSSSLSKRSHSSHKAKILLPPPTGWGEV
jgi:uncharacterized protein YegL